MVRADVAAYLVEVHSSLNFIREKRPEEIKELTSAGKIPFAVEVEKNPKLMVTAMPYLMGSVAAVINDVPTAKEIVDRMVKEAVERLEAGGKFVSAEAKL